MIKWAVILLATAGLFGSLYAFGLLQSAPLHAWGFGVSWAMLLSGVAALVMGLKIRTA